MKVKDLNGVESKWRLNAASIRENPSGLHLSARSVIKELYPTLLILEEVPIKIDLRQTLFLDFYIPLCNTAVEVHGEQHYKFVPHFHSNMYGFINHKKNDNKKIEWCEINNIKLIELPFNEGKELWKKRLLTKK